MENVEMLTQMILSPMQQLWAKFSSMIPNIIAAAVMLVIGYLLARLTRLIVRKALQKLGIDSLAEKLKISSALQTMNINKPVSDLFGMLVFLFIMLAFILSAVEALGFDRVSASIDQLLFYLPKVLSAALVLIAGLFIADLVRSGVRNTAEGVGLDYAPALSKVLFGLVVVVTVMLAIDQLEVELVLLNVLIEIVLVAVGIAVALSLGLGTRELSRHIVSGVYVRDLYQAGDLIEVDGNKGTLVEVGTVKSVLELTNGSKVSFSNESLLNHTVVIHTK